MIKNIVVIGAGTMGNGIAHTFAQSGFSVNLVDVSQEALDKGLKTITTNLDRIIACPIKSFICKLYIHKDTVIYFLTILQILTFIILKYVSLWDY